MLNPVTVQVVVVSKCFFGNTLLAILHLEITKKNLFAADSADAAQQLAPDSSTLSITVALSVSYQREFIKNS